MREFIENSHAEEERLRVAASVDPGEGKPPRAKRIDRAYYTRIRQSEDQDWELVTTQNISQSGIFFRYDRPLDVGSELFLSLALPALLDPVYCQGTIVRVEDQTLDESDAESYRIGVRFSGLSKLATEALREYGEKHGRN